MQESGAQHNTQLDDPEAMRGDLWVRELWNDRMDSIIDVRITDTDNKSQKNTRDPMKVLAKHEKEKKNKYQELCLAQRRSFTPFVVSCDGLLGREAELLLKRLSELLSTKWEKPYSVVHCFVKTRISFAIIRATNYCLRGPRIPGSYICQSVQWQGGSGLGLYRSQQ